jgi:hypothetical protein
MNRAPHIDAMPDGHSSALFFTDRAREITEFWVKSNRQRGLGSSGPAPSVPTLYAYVFFSLVDRTLFVVRRHSAIVAALTVWGMPEAEIRQMDAEGESTWQWRRSRDDADSLCVGEVIGARELLPALVRQVSSRWPNWRDKKVFTYRRGKLVQLDPATVEKLIGPRAKSAVAVRSTHGIT